MPKPYPPEFRRRALDLAESGRTIREVATAVGIAESCLYGWRSRDLVDRGLKERPATQIESEELAGARARIKDLEDEVKILRKAAAVEQVVPPRDRFRLVAELAEQAPRSSDPAHSLASPVPGTTKHSTGHLRPDQSDMPG